MRGMRTAVFAAIAALTLSSLAPASPAASTPSSAQLGATPSAPARGRPSEREIAELRRAVEQDLDNVAKRRRFARALMAADRVAPAIDQLQEALRRDSDDPETHHLLGICYQRKERMEDALAEFERALELDPGLQEARIGAAVALAALGREEEALERYGAVLEAEPDRVDVRFSRAGLHARLGHTEDAVADYDRVLDARPEAVPAALGRARILAEAERPTEAVSGLERTLEAVDEDQTRGLLLLTMGNLLVQADRLEQATARYREAAEVLPDSLEIRTSLARVLAARGLHGQAADQLGAIVEAAPDESGARLAHQAMLVRAGRFEEAVQVLEEGLERSGDDPQLRATLARLLAACLDQAACDPERALTLADAAYRDQPTPPHAETLALALAAQERFEEAVQVQSQVVTAAEQEGVDESVLERLRRELAAYERGEKPDGLLELVSPASGNGGV